MPENIRSEQDIFRFQVAVNEASILEDAKGVKQLCREYLDKLCREALEGILLDKLVKVGRQQLEDETEMAAMDERVAEPQDVMLVVRIAGIVELHAGCFSSGLGGTH